MISRIADDLHVLRTSASLKRVDPHKGSKCRERTDVMVSLRESKTVLQSSVLFQVEESVCVKVGSFYLTTLYRSKGD